MHKLPTKWTGYTQYPHPRNVSKPFSLHPRVPTPLKPSSPSVSRTRLYADPEVRAAMVGGSLASLVPLFSTLRTERDLQNFVTEKKRAKLDTAVSTFSRPEIVFNKSRPNRASPSAPLTNNEIYEKERRVWGERNPKKLTMALQWDERDREQLEKKRRAKYPMHFNEDKHAEGDNAESKSQSTHTTYTVA